MVADMLDAQEFHKMSRRQANASNATCSALEVKSPLHCVMETHIVTDANKGTGWPVGDFWLEDVLTQFHTE